MDNVEKIVERLRNRRSAILKLSILSVAAAGFLAFGMHAVIQTTPSLPSAEDFETPATQADLFEITMAARGQAAIAGMLTPIAACLGLLLGLLGMHVFRTSKDYVILDLWDRVKELEARSGAESNPRIEADAATPSEGDARGDE